MFVESKQRPATIRRDMGCDMSRALARIQERIDAIERESHAVFEYLTRHPGSSAGAVAAGLGTGHPAVSAQLHRGEAELFVSRDGRWYPVPAADPRGVNGAVR